MFDTHVRRGVGGINSSGLMGATGGSHVLQTVFVHVWFLLEMLSWCSRIRLDGELFGWLPMVGGVFRFADVVPHLMGFVLFGVCTFPLVPPCLLGVLVLLFDCPLFGMLPFSLTFLAQVSGSMLLPAAIPGTFIALLWQPFLYPVSALLLLRT